MHYGHFLSRTHTHTNTHRLAGGVSEAKSRRQSLCMCARARQRSISVLIMWAFYCLSGRLLLSLPASSAAISLFFEWRCGFLLWFMMLFASTNGPSMTPLYTNAGLGFFFLPFFGCVTFYMDDSRLFTRTRHRRDDHRMLLLSVCCLALRAKKCMYVFLYAVLWLELEMVRFSK